MTDTILIDLDDTILDFRAAEANAVRGTLEREGVAVTDEMVALYSRINDEEWKKFERGETTRERLVVHRFERLYDAIGFAGDAEHTMHTYEGMLKCGYDMLPGAYEALEVLSQRYTLYLVSNGTACVQDSRLAGTGIRRFFHEVFVSERVGCNKPKPAFFDAVFAAIGEEKRATSVIVGDSLTSDIQGGIHAGIRTIWVNTRRLAPRDDVVPDVTVASLTEVAAALDEM